MTLPAKRRGFASGTRSSRRRRHKEASEPTRRTNRILEWRDSVSLTAGANDPPRDPTGQASLRPVVLENGPKRRYTELFGGRQGVSDQQGNQCFQTHYRGMVQGVGFRYTTCRVAARFQVTGFVKNLPDGRVQLVAEGPAGELRRFLAAVAAELGRYIDDSEQAALPATGQFAGFNVRT